MDKIIYNISSFNRKDTLIKTINSIFDQCDVINIALNGYTEIPIELYDKKINLLITDNEKGDAYKFYFLSRYKGYYFTIDDDLIYPPNYSEFMIDKVEKYNRNSIITLHGRTFHKFPIDGYYKKGNSYINHFIYENDTDTKVHFGGTGVMCFHTDLLKLPINYFVYPNMADIWIGKYAIENQIDLICSEHPGNFVKQQHIDESIYNNYSTNDSIQTEIVNEIFSEKKISVVIPTFNNIGFLDECLDSVLRSMKNLDGEILVGIDGCETTLEYITKKEYDLRIKFYYFNVNSGPYVVKNSLSQISKSEIILFFDSDDIMEEGFIDELITDGPYYDFCKPKMINFNNGSDINKDGKGEFGEGILAIKKSIFLSLNGFEPWRCAADSEFISRLYKNNYTFKGTNSVRMFRRIHPESITMKSETSYYSKQRKRYVELMNSKKYFGPLDKLHTEIFYKIPNQSKIKNNTNYNKISSQPIVTTQKQILLSIIERKKVSTNTTPSILQQKREKINTFNRFTPPKKTKRK